MYLCVPMASIQVTAMTQGNYTKLLHREVFTPRSFLHKRSYISDTEKFLTQWSFHTQSVHALTRLHTEVLKFLHTAQVFTQKCFYTQKLLDREVFTQRIFLHTEAFAHDFFKPTEGFTPRNFFTKKSLHRDVFTQRGFFRGKKSLRRGAFTHRPVCTHKL